MAKPGDDLRLHGRVWLASKNDLWQSHARWWVNGHKVWLASKNDLWQSIGLVEVRADLFGWHRKMIYGKAGRGRAHQQLRLAGIEK